MAEVLEPIQLHTVPAMELDADQFFAFCQANREYRIERSAEKDIIIMSPEAASSGRGNFRLSYCFEKWAEMDGSGQCFGSSTGFILPNGAIRSPDIAWVRNERLKSISEADWNKFLPLCPDFALELRSPTDRVRSLQEKVQEYISNGTGLGWLLDPILNQVHIYRPGTKPEIIDNPAEISGDPVLPNFKLEVPRIWASINRAV